MRISVTMEIDHKIYNAFRKKCNENARLYGRTLEILIEKWLKGRVKI